ncbi:MAG TPA: polysaccharide biosynthesis/export family protein [Ferruginibacter sp.]|nr:polysaccharide biosynthesis/export family protein [Ferruginibacter sp.]HMP20180.1 polysaccharide biosynthesis/export family protein [Ferruginibacter sp.]
MITSRNVFVLLSFVAFFSVSCTSTQKATYFNNMKDTTIAAAAWDENLNIIPKNAILSIHVTSLNKEATEIFNLTNTFAISYTTSAGTGAQYAGYLVDAEGFIEMPMLGKIKAAGITKGQLKEKITGLLKDKKLLLEPVVSIRHLNFEVTVLGDVARPTVVTVPSERITLLKALGVAGDITIYGKRENVMLIRETPDGQKIVRRINLNDGRYLVSSPYYYLQPNDMIYVESDENRVASVSRKRVVLPSVLSVLSMAALVVVTVARTR